MPFSKYHPSDLLVFEITASAFVEYIADTDGNPRLPPGMRELLHEDLNKGFEF